ncbi:MAG: hypothetical protein BWY78_00231 [Alphaproteobacteria bacterium ADurb.Bin438]|nr:MAG: hypothetical protein BWY78_00231 [Alphaproteobacteria bacterium ADurb.Bin438]
MLNSGLISIFEGVGFNASVFESSVFVFILFVTLSMSFDGNIASIPKRAIADKTIAKIKFFKSLVRFSMIFIFSFF